MRIDGEKRKPADWADEFGFTITNPTGWARRGIEFERPITADAYVLMSHDSIIKINSFQKMIDTGAITLPEEKSDE